MKHRVTHPLQEARYHLGEAEKKLQAAMTELHGTKPTGSIEEARLTSCGEHIMAAGLAASQTTTIAAEAFELCERWLPDENRQSPGTNDSETAVKKNGSLRLDDSPLQPVAQDSDAGR